MEVLSRGSEVLNLTPLLSPSIPPDHVRRDQAPGSFSHGEHGRGVRAEPPLPAPVLTFGPGSPTGPPEPFSPCRERRNGTSEAVCSLLLPFSLHDWALHPTSISQSLCAPRAEDLQATASCGPGICLLPPWRHHRAPPGAAPLGGQTRPQTDGRLEATARDCGSVHLGDPAQHDLLLSPWCCLCLSCPAVDSVLFRFFLPERPVVHRTTEQTVSPGPR